MRSKLARMSAGKASSSPFTSAFKKTNDHVTWQYTFFAIDFQSLPFVLAISTSYLDRRKQPWRDRQQVRLGRRNRAANRQKGIGFARRALAVAGNDPGVLADAAFALACFGEDIVVMTALVDRALTFNPNYARGWHASFF